MLVRLHLELLLRSGVGTVAHLDDPHFATLGCSDAHAPAEFNEVRRCPRPHPRIAKSLRARNLWQVFNQHDVRSDFRPLGRSFGQIRISEHRVWYSDVGDLQGSELMLRSYVCNGLGCTLGATVNSFQDQPASAVRCRQLSWWGGHTLPACGLWSPTGSTTGTLGTAGSAILACRAWRTCRRCSSSKSAHIWP